MKSPPLGASSFTTLVRSEIQTHWRLYVVWAVWAVAFLLLVRATLGGPDGSRYLAYLRSLVFDRDLVLVNELEVLGQRVISTASGYSAQIANVGVLPFWAPWYLLGMAAAWLNGDVGSGLRSNYHLWLAFGDWLYGLLALIATYGWLARRVDRTTAVLATLLAGMGTSFVYYMTALAPSYHMVAALLSVLFLRLWDGKRESRAPSQWFGLGLLAGILASIAQYHFVLLAFPVLDLMAQLGTRLSQTGSLVQRVTDVLRQWAKAFPLIPGLLIPFLPQMVVWGAVYGNPFANPYTMDADWSGARFLDVLFSSYHGLFFTSPVALFAVAGWLVGLRIDRRLFTGAILVLLGIAYSSSTRLGWWGGVSFGMRYAIGLTPLFAAGLAVLICSLPAGLARRAALAAAAFCALWTYGYFLQAFTNLTSFSEYHPASQWVAQQLTILRDPLPVLAAHWLLPRPAILFTYLPALLLVSLLVMRLVGNRLILGIGLSRLTIFLLTCVPVMFAAYLLATIPNSKSEIAALRAQGYFEKNRARGEFDWEQFANEYVERSRYWSATGQPEAARADLAGGMRLWQNSSRRLMDPAEQREFTPLSVRFGDVLELLGYRLEPPAIQQGVPLTITLLWRAGKRLPVDYDTGVLLLDLQGAIVTRTGPAFGVDAFPASWWLPGEMITDRHQIDVSGIEPATLLRVRAEVFDPIANKRLAAPANGVFAEVRAPAPLREHPSVVGTLGDRIVLASSSIGWKSLSVDVDLVWRAITMPGGDYTVFVHLLDAQDRIVAQSDAKPNAGRYPTRVWAGGEVIPDRHRITLDQPKQALVKRIIIGMYDPVTGQRLPTGNGLDFIVLPQ